MLDAQDRNSVLSWTERQLGEAACRVALVEISDEVAPEWTGKSGSADNRAGCQAFISVTPDSVQRVAGNETAEFNSLVTFLAHRQGIRKLSVH